MQGGGREERDCKAESNYAPRTRLVFEVRHQENTTEEDREEFRRVVVKEKTDVRDRNVSDKEVGFCKELLLQW